VTPEDLHLSAQRREQLILKFADDRVVAHQTLFAHRHPDLTPPFHDELVELWHSTAPKVLTMAFRGAGKSTLAEEALTLAACMKLVRNVLIIGSNSDRANDRLRAIKHELETNELLIELFGDLRGSTWNEGKVVLANGVALQAFGRGQALRGVKHHDARPDFCFVDDVEEQDHVSSPDARAETMRWLMTELVPALDKGARLRVAATPLDRDALPMRLMKQPGWETRVFPVEHVDARGERRATWEDRFPLPWIGARREEFEQAGLGHAYAQEYLCQPEDPASKVFTSSMFRIEPKVHVWQSTYAFYDPARTIKQTSATTGWAVWSWVGGRLIVWDGGGERWQPDQIIDHIFKINEQYHPVKIGVERDGLEEFIMQPLRHAMARRGVLVPIEGMKAPKGKIQFINGLQPFFAAGEVTFAKPLPELTAQFLSFPSGKIDAPNALAYSLLMKPGQAVYEDFASQHVVETVLRQERTPVWLALNATRGCTTGVLCQFADGRLGVLRDWVLEGDPGQCISMLIKEARMEASTAIKLVAPPTAFRDYDVVGLAGAVRRLQQDFRQGAAPLDGRAVLRELLKQSIRGLPALAVGHAAHWTLNALAGGFAREVGPHGMVTDAPGEGIYSTLMEGLESCVGMVQTAGVEEVERNYAYTATGQRYVTSLPQRAVFVPRKDRWWEDGPPEPLSLLRRR
jgi:hypothetical protein